jgi:hypothetical protein
MEQIRLLAFVVVITVIALPISASAWNIPGHMLSGAIPYQVLQQGNPQTIEKVTAALEKHPWYANQMAGEASRCFRCRPNSCAVHAGGKVGRRYSHQGQATPHRGPWHYINWSFKPEGQPASVQIREPVRPR